MISQTERWVNEGRRLRAFLADAEAVECGCRGEAANHIESLRGAGLQLTLDPRRMASSR